jgi:hypothetical protein
MLEQFLQAVYLLTASIMAKAAFEKVGVTYTLDPTTGNVQDAYKEYEGLMKEAYLLLCQATATPDPQWQKGWPLPQLNVTGPALSGLLSSPLTSAVLSAVTAAFPAAGPIVAILKPLVSALGGTSTPAPAPTGTVPAPIPTP